MSQGLPQYIALNYSSGFLYRHMRMVSDNQQYRGYLSFDRTNVVGSATKFHLEAAQTTGGGRFRHIRCCYSNKYMALKDDRSAMLSMSADKMEEDLSKFDCTLFEPIRLSDGRIQLRHVRTGGIATILNSPGLVVMPFLYLSFEPSDNLNRFAVRNWNDILIFPQHVVFKGDNGKYLGAVKEQFFGDYIEKFKFIVDDDVGDASVGHTTGYSKDGNVIFRSHLFQQTWTLIPSFSNMIWATLGTGSRSQFTAEKVGADLKKVTFRNVDNGRFCRRFTDRHERDTLFADATSPINETHMEVQEAVFSRKIYNIRYRLMDSRIYNENVQTLSPGSDFTNGGSQPQVVTREISYTRTESSTWDHGVNFKLGIETTFKTRIPLILDGEITTSLNFEYGHEWGKEESVTKELTVSHTVIVPPRSRIRVTLLATKGMCDVPFSYTQRDILTDGRQVITYHEDGLYTGVTLYSFKYDTRRFNI